MSLVTCKKKKKKKKKEKRGETGGKLSVPYIEDQTN